METEKTAENWATFALSELAWGSLWAICLQHTQWGRKLATRHTWLTVVIGVSVTVFLMWPILPLVALIKIGAAFVLSSIGIIARSLANEDRVDKVLR